MIRFYLMTMFALPLLELWDRFVALHTEQLSYDGAFTIGPRYGWHEAIDHNINLYARIFHFHVPFVRDWRRSQTISSDGVVEGWHSLMLLHSVTSHPGARRGWWREWLPRPGCTPVPLSEQMRLAP